MKTTKGEYAIAIYLELAIARGQPPSLVFGKDSKTGRGMRQMYNGGKIEISRCALKEAVGIGSSRQAE